MIVFHITSIQGALSILRSGLFHPKSGDAADGDNGLNLLDSRNGYMAGQMFASQQCIIFFECRLPLIKTSTGAKNPLASGVLHDQHPWRMFIRGPIGRCSLRVTHVRIRDWAINEHMDNTSPRRLQSFIVDLLRRKRRLRLLKELRSLYRSRCACIQVAT